MKYLLLFIIAFFGAELYAQKCKCISQQFEEVEAEPTKVFKFKNGNNLNYVQLQLINLKKTPSLITKILQL